MREERRRAWEMRNIRNKARVNNTGRCASASAPRGSRRSRPVPWLACLSAQRSQRRSINRDVDRARMPSDRQHQNKIKTKNKLITSQHPIENQRLLLPNPSLSLTPFSLSLALFLPRLLPRARSAIPRFCVLTTSGHLPRFVDPNDPGMPPQAYHIRTARHNPDTYKGSNPQWTVGSR